MKKKEIISATSIIIINLHHKFWHISNLLSHACGSSLLLLLSASSPRLLMMMEMEMSPPPSFFSLIYRIHDFFLHICQTVEHLSHKKTNNVTCYLWHLGLFSFLIIVMLNQRSRRSICEQSYSGRYRLYEMSRYSEINKISVGKQTKVLIDCDWVVLIYWMHGCLFYVSDVNFHCLSRWYVMFIFNFPHMTLQFI